MQIEQLKIITRLMENVENPQEDWYGNHILSVYDNTTLIPSPEKSAIIILHTLKHYIPIDPMENPLIRCMVRTYEIEPKWASMENKENEKSTTTTLAMMMNLKSFSFLQALKECRFHLAKRTSSGSQRVQWWVERGIKWAVEHSHFTKHWIYSVKAVAFRILAVCYRAASSTI